MSQWTEADTLLEIHNHLWDVHNGLCRPQRLKVNGREIKIQSVDNDDSKYAFVNIDGRKFITQNEHKDSKYGYAIRKAKREGLVMKITWVIRGRDLWTHRIITKEFDDGRLVTVIKDLLKQENIFENIQELA